MAIQTINLGTYANDGTGDDLRTAFLKVNANFAELNTLTITGGTNLGTGTAVFAGNVASPATGDNLAFKTLVSGPNITITNNDNEITIAGSDSIYNVVEDLTPQLGGNLDLNGFNIVGANNPAAITILNSSLDINAYNVDTENFNPVGINGIQISGSNFTTAGTVRFGTYDNFDDNLNIVADQELRIRSNKNQIYIESPTIFTSDINAASISGPTYGTHTGNVIGDTTGTHTGLVVGTVTSLSNHTLSSLSDVSNTAPSTGQSLVWSGTTWEPKTITGGSSGSAFLDLGSFTSPNTVSNDFGSFTSPADISLDFGIISESPGFAFSIVAVNGEQLITANSDLSTLNFVAGAGIQITANSLTDTLTISNVGTPAVLDTMVFSAIEVAGQPTINASSSSTLTLAAGNGISLSTDAITDTVTITSTVTPGAGLGVRNALTASTSSIADGASADVTIANGYNGYMLYKIQTSAAAWVRIYTDAASRTADASRTELQDPAPNSGVIVEVVTTGPETILLAPGVLGFNNETTPDMTIPMAVTNKSGSTTTIDVTLTAVQLEV